MFPSLFQCARDAKRHGNLYFAALLPEHRIREAFGEASETFHGWIYTPSVLVWCFLAQVLSADHSCRETVARLNAFRAMQRKRPCSPETGAYCTARDKLPEQACQRLFEQSGDGVSQSTTTAWRWHGRRLRVVDGTTITMPDTPENQREYPQPNTQKPGCGFPIMRIVVLFCLSTGAAVRMACGRYAGKLTGECSLFRSIAHALETGDVLVADQYYGGWFDVVLLAQRGVDVVIRKYHTRRTDFRTGVRLGANDHVVVWPKPPRPEWLDLASYRRLPPTFALREFRKRIATPGFRTREIVVVTTLRDPAVFSLDELADLFRRRWQAELHLRSLKTTLQMDHLRCLKPHRVRNELRMHLTAYNLLRNVMAEAAVATGRTPCQVSFKGTMQTTNEFLRMLVGVENVDRWSDSLLACVAAHLVDDRPNRNEPRVCKRRPKSYPPMTRPRHDHPSHRAA
jgi:putative transposase